MPSLVANNKMPIAKNNLLISLITHGKSEIISRGF